MAARSNPEEIVTRLLASHSQSAESALRRSLAIKFTTAEAEDIISSVITGRATTSDLWGQVESDSLSIST